MSMCCVVPVPSISNLSNIFFRFVKTYAETDPTNLKTAIAYRTRRSFYVSLCEYSNRRGRKPVSMESFCRILRESFPEIKFVRVSYNRSAGGSEAVRREVVCVLAFDRFQTRKLEAKNSHMLSWIFVFF